MDNPQSFNLYAYVRNNPLSNADPDGHDCVVQTRTSDKTESVSTTSGSCDNVKVGDGQSKTYVPGTVTGIQRGQDGRSIDIGYKPDDGSANTAVKSADSAPYPDRPGLAWGFNQDGYRQLAGASKVVNGIAIGTAVVSGGFACLAYCAAADAAITSAESASGDLAIKAITYLQRWGIPAAAAATMALKAMLQIGTQPNINAKIQFNWKLVQKLNQMVREYHQSQGAH